MDLGASVVARAVHLLGLALRREVANPQVEENKMGKPARALTRRERIESTNRGLRAWGAAFGKPEVAERLVMPLAPKREIRRPVDKRPVGPSEHQVQAAVISWWWLQHEIYGLPPFSLFAVPNGGARDAITGSHLKAEGVRRGSPDLILAKPSKQYHGLFIEMKVGSNKPTPEQEAFIAYLDSVGYKTAVHWSSETAIQEIKDYLA